MVDRARPERVLRGAVLLADESAAQEAGIRRTWYRVLGRCYPVAPRISAVGSCQALLYIMLGSRVQSVREPPTSVSVEDDLE